MDIKDLAGKMVLRGLGPFDLDNDREDWCIEFTDGTKVYFSPNAYSTHTTDCEVYPPNARNEARDGSLWITVETTAALQIDRAVRDGVALAHRLRCGVSFRFNGRTVYCYPDSTPAQIMQRWNDDMARERRTANAEGTVQPPVGHSSP
jgi:hypothetical protein